MVMYPGKTREIRYAKRDCTQFIYDPLGGNAGPMILSSPFVAGPMLMSSPLNPVPEPSTLALLVAGLVVGFGVWRRKK